MEWIENSDMVKYLDCILSGDIVVREETKQKILMNMEKLKNTSLFRADQKLNILTNIFSPL
jgi:hypothetical protein